MTNPSLGKVQSTMTSSNPAQSNSNLGAMPGQVQPQSIAQSSTSSVALNLLSQLSMQSTSSIPTSISTTTTTTFSIPTSIATTTTTTVTTWEQVVAKQKSIIERQQSLLQQPFIREQHRAKQQRIMQSLPGILKLRNSFERLVDPQQPEQPVNQPQSIEESALSSLEAGKKFLFEGKFSEAIFCFQLGLRNTRLNPEFRASDETNALLRQYLESAHQHLLEAGKKFLFVDHKISEAIDCFQLGLRNTKFGSEFHGSDETNALLSYYEGRAYQYNGDLARARIATLNALKFQKATDETKAIIYAFLADITTLSLESGKKFLFQGKISDAIFCFQLGLRNTQLDPEFRASDETNERLRYYLENAHQHLLEAGKKFLFVDHKISEAIDCFQLGLRNAQLNPELRASDETNALLSYYEGMAYYHSGDLARACTATLNALNFQKATDERKAIIYGFLADIHNLSFETALAISAYKCALSFNCSSDELNAQWSYRLGVIHSDIGQVPEAIAVFNKGLEFKDAMPYSKMQLLHRLGMTLSRSGQLKDAKDLLRFASMQECATNENKAYFELQIGEILLKEGRRLEALDAILRAYNITSVPETKDQLMARLKELGVNVELSHLTQNASILQ